MLSLRVHSVAPVGDRNAPQKIPIRVVRRARLAELRQWPQQLAQRAWSYTQVDANGFYSLEKLYACQVCDFALATQLLIVLAAALPLIVVPLSLELLPLQDPALGWKANSVFYGRELLRFWVLTACTNIQAQEYVVEMRLTWPTLALLTSLQASFYVLTLMVLPSIVGVFPVPFSAIAPLPLFYAAGGLFHYAFVRDVIRAHPSLQPKHKRLVSYVNFSGVLMLVYVGYGFAFRHVGVAAQIALSLFLQVVKQWAKHRTWTLSHVNAHDDISAECVSCGAHFFHALFSATCLQNSNSISMLCIVVSLSVLQDVLAIRTLHAMSVHVDKRRQLQRAGQAKVDEDVFSEKWTEGLLRVAESVSTAEEREAMFDSSIMTVRSAYDRHQRVASRERPPLATAGSAIFRLTDSMRVRQRAHLTHAVAQLYHYREVVLLRMYVDVVVPSLFLVYSAAMLYLPNKNRDYFDSLHGLAVQDLRDTALKLALLVALKVVAMVVLLRLLHYYEQPSGLRQLAFVLRSQCWSMQPRFLINVLQVLEFPLAHMGNDLSFEFAWIHHRSTAS